MTKEETALLHRLETQTRLLIERYRQVETRCEQLQEQLEKKAAQLEEKDSEVSLLREQLLQLKLAKMLDISDADLKMTRGKINKLIREVDTCIALLNI